jgi:hypothetical protein
MRTHLALAVVCLDVRFRQVTRRLLVVTNPAGGVDLYRR